MKKIDKNTNIIGLWTGTIEDLVRPFLTGGDLIRARKIALMYIKYCNIFRIRADIAFAQGPCHETGKLTFKGIAKPEWNNFAGLGITGAEAKQTFASEDLGVLAHIVHLAWYVYPDHMHTLCSRKFDPRHFEVPGKHHPKYNGDSTLGNLSGKWAVPGKYKQPDGSWITYDMKIAKYANIINDISISEEVSDVEKVSTIADELKQSKPPSKNKNIPVFPWVAPVKENGRYDIIVQLGHIGRIKGATGAYREQEFTQALGDAIEPLLKRSGLNFRIMGADDWLKVKPNEAKIFFSLHGDGSKNKKAGGYSLGFKPDSDEKFKEELAVSYGELCGLRRRSDNYTAGLRKYYSWRDDLKRKPHVVAEYYALLEHCFMSNKKERTWLFNSIEEIAEHHVNLITKFLKENNGN